MTDHQVPEHQMPDHRMTGEQASGEQASGGQTSGEQKTEPAENPPTAEPSAPSDEPPGDVEPGADVPGSDRSDEAVEEPEVQLASLSHLADEEGPALRTALEAILLVVDEPVSEVLLAQVTERPTEEVRTALRELAREYDETGRGFELREVAGGWRYYTRRSCAAYVERFVLDGQQARLTQAALETLAVVAYRQPVSRARVSAVRGVNVDGVMRTLVTRGLVQEAGQDGESGATLYRTTSYFLERLGLRDLAELPDLAPYLPELDALDEMAAS